MRQQHTMARFRVPQLIGTVCLKLFWPKLEMSQLSSSYRASARSSHGALPSPGLPCQVPSGAISESILTPAKSHGMAPTIACSVAGVPPADAGPCRCQACGLKWVLSQLYCTPYSAGCPLHSSVSVLYSCFGTTWANRLSFSVLAEKLFSELQCSASCRLIITSVTQYSWSAALMYIH